MLSKKRLMPNKKNIYDFWHNLEGRSILENYSTELKSQKDLLGKVKVDCFACGSGADIQRCHIEAKVNGGTDAVSNLHLLCAKCHVESEMFGPQRYWNWLKTMVDEHWMPFSEHFLLHMEKIGFSEKKLLEVYKISGFSGALEYMSYFAEDSKEGTENFKINFMDRLKSYQAKVDKTSDYP